VPVSLISALSTHISRQVVDQLSKLWAEDFSTPLSRTLEVKYREVQLGNISESHNPYLNKTWCSWSSTSTATRCASPLSKTAISRVAATAALCRLARVGPRDSDHRVPVLGLVWISSIFWSFEYPVLLDILPNLLGR
jgi:hypothetical protein